MSQAFLNVCEIFSSIQGESSFSGFPFFFIRTSGCNLRCRYCDTKYSWQDGEKMSVNFLIEKAKESGLRRVLITGGEPLIQKESFILMDELVKEGFEVFVETNGSVPISGIREEVIVIMDVKTPSSGESHKNRLENLNFLKKRDEVKFVISDYRDFCWAVDFVRKYSIEDVVEQILFSPVIESLSPKTLGEWIVEKRLNCVRLQVQLHKLISMK